MPQQSPRASLMTRRQTTLRAASRREWRSAGWCSSRLDQRHSLAAAPDAACAQPHPSATVLFTMRHVHVGLHATSCCKQHHLVSLKPVLACACMTHVLAAGLTRRTRRPPLQSLLRPWTTSSSSRQQQRTTRRKQQHWSGRSGKLTSSSKWQDAAGSGCWSVVV